MEVNLSCLQSWWAMAHSFPFIVFLLYICRWLLCSSWSVFPRLDSPSSSSPSLNWVFLLLSSGCLHPLWVYPWTLTSPETFLGWTNREGSSHIFLQLSCIYQDIFFCWCWLCAIHHHSPVLFCRAETSNFLPEVVFQLLWYISITVFQLLMHCP